MWGAGGQCRCRYRTVRGYAVIQQAERWDECTMIRTGSSTGTLFVLADRPQCFLRQVHSPAPQPSCSRYHPQPPVLVADHHRRLLVFPTIY